MTPADRRMALRSHRIPNNNSSAPTRSCTRLSGIACSTGPNPTMSASSTPDAKHAPVNAGRQPRTIPMARTTVSASTNSTRDARKAAIIDGPACTQSIMTLLRNGSQLQRHSRQSDHRGKTRGSSHLVTAGLVPAIPIICHGAIPPPYPPPLAGHCRAGGEAARLAMVDRAGRHEQDGRSGEEDRDQRNKQRKRDGPERDDFSSNRHPLQLIVGA